MRHVALLLIGCLGFCGCHCATEFTRADEQDDHEQAEEVAEEDRESVSQRVRRLSPRRHTR